MGELLFGLEDALSPLVKLVSSHNHGGPTSRSRKNKKRKRDEDPQGSNVCKPSGGNLPRSRQNPSPWIPNLNQQLVPPQTPLISSSVSSSFPALSAIDLVALCSLLSQQPSLPPCAPGSSASQFKLGDPNASSWPNSGAK